MDIERRRSHEAAEMRVQPSGERPEQRRNREGDQPGAERVDAEAANRLGQKVEKIPVRTPNVQNRLRRTRVDPLVERFE